MKRFLSTLTLSALIGLSALTKADQPIEKKSNFYQYLIVGGVITSIAGLAYWHKEALDEAVKSSAQKAQEYLPTQEVIQTRLATLSNALPTKESLKQALSTAASYAPTLPTKDGITEKLTSLGSYIPSKDAVLAKFADMYKNLWTSKSVIFPA